MNKNAKRVVLSGMAVIMMVSCGTAKKGGQSDTGVASKGDMEAIDNDYLILSDAQRDLLAKNNTFAINLFNKTNGMDSRVISPLSVTGLMTILANGADGDTRQEILNTLGWTGASMEEINEIYGLLVKQVGVHIVAHPKAEDAHIIRCLSRYIVKYCSCHRHSLGGQAIGEKDEGGGADFFRQAHRLDHRPVEIRRSHGLQAV